MRLPLQRRWRTRAHSGQGMVEMALILPLLVLLLVMALDVGRVFFGWVALHNAARIGADFAAGHAEYWDGMLSTYSDERARYENLIEDDLQSLNCALPGAGPDDQVDEPVFSGFVDGDMVQAEVTCSFGLITPLAEALLGGPINMTVRTDFPVNSTIGALPDGGGGGPPDPPPACSAPVAGISTTPAASGGQVNINTGETVTFTDDSETGDDCGTPTWEWDFDSEGTETTQGPHTKTFTNPGPPTFRNFTVTLSVTTVYGSDTASVTVRVRK